jgi:hypothetical protein
MNDHIRELYRQSQVDGYFGKAFSPEKFAELIVRECIVDFYRRYLDICSDEDITVQVERYVKEYFGVEE